MHDVFKVHFVCILKRETRQKYFDVWKKKLQRKIHQAPIVLPHHGPSSGLAKTNKASEREREMH
jgi:hypothetical protein